MAQRALEAAVRYIRRVSGREHNQLNDRQLLHAFSSQGNGEAFAILIERHGKMVLGVCRRVLGNVHDAEDAFQATFLVLARKAGSVVPREQVGNWLHGVALRTALEARTRRARRRGREMQVKDMPHPTASPEVNWDALHRLLDRELGRLPMKYRSAIILCDLEGRSRKEAARQLGLAEGTLSSRLATGRQMLARRLLRHGPIVPVAGLTSALAAQATAASVRSALVSATARAALVAGGGQAATDLFSAQVVSLSQGVLKTMFLHRLKVLTVLLVGMVLGGVGVGAGILPGKSQVVAGEPPAPLAQAARLARAEPEEPLDGGMLLDEQVQKELRLSANQVRRLKEAAANSDKRNEGVRKEIQQIEKRIAQLQKEAQDLGTKIAADRDHALRDAAPGILSARALLRLRQIQRQAHSPDQLLKDPRVQRLLKLDDEQMMNIDKALKDSSGNLVNVYSTSRLTLTQPFQEIDLGVGLGRGTDQFFFVDSELNPKALAKVMEVLTEEQRRALRSWLGEPYRATTNVNWLWSVDVGKKR